MLGWDKRDGAIGGEEALSHFCTFLLLLCKTFLDVAARKTAWTGFGIRNKWPLRDNMHSLLPSKIKYVQQAFAPSCVPQDLGE